MKKRLALFLACALAVALLLSACGGEKWQRQKATGTTAACAEKAVDILTDYLQVSVSKSDAADQLSALREQLDALGASDYKLGSAEYAIYSELRTLSYGLELCSEAELRDTISILRYSIGKKAAKAVGTPARRQLGDEAVFTNAVFADLPYTYAFSGASDGSFVLDLTFDRMYGTTASEALSRLSDIYAVAATHGNPVSVIVTYQAYSQDIFRATIYRDGDTLSLMLTGQDYTNILSHYTSLDDLPSLVRDASRYAG